MILHNKQFADHVKGFGKAIDLSNEAMGAAGISIDRTGTRASIGDRSRLLTNVNINYTDELDPGNTYLELGGDVPYGDSTVRLFHTRQGSRDKPNASVGVPTLRGARMHADPNMSEFFVNAGTAPNTRKMLARGVLGADDGGTQRFDYVPINDVQNSLNDAEGRFNKRNVRQSFSNIFRSIDPENYQKMIQNRSSLGNQYAEDIKERGYVRRTATSYINGWPTSAFLRPHAGGWALDEDQPHWKVR